MRRRRLEQGRGVGAIRRVSWSLLGAGLEWLAILVDEPALVNSCFGKFLFWQNHVLPNPWRRIGASSKPYLEFDDAPLEELQPSILASRSCFTAVSELTGE